MNGKGTDTFKMAIHNYLEYRAATDELFTPLFGWRFDFSDVLKTFLVRQYGRWTEYRAMDKTALRKTLFGRIEKIVEINK